MMTVPLILSLSCFSLHLSQRVTTIYDMACFFWGGGRLFSQPKRSPLAAFFSASSPSLGPPSLVLTGCSSMDDGH